MNVQRSLGQIPEQFVAYFTCRFPRLLLHVYEAMKYFRSERIFRDYYYQPPQSPRQRSVGNSTAPHLHTTWPLVFCTMWLLVFCTMWPLVFCTMWILVFDIHVIFRIWGQIKFWTWVCLGADIFAMFTNKKVFCNLIHVINFWQICTAHMLYSCVKQTKLQDLQD